MYIHIYLNFLLIYSSRSQLSQHFSPPSRPPALAPLAIAEQRRKHNAHIHAASAPFYVESTKGGSVRPLATRICFFWAVAWIIWPESSAAEGELSHSVCPKSKHERLSRLTPFKFLHVCAGRQPLHRQLYLCVCVSVACMFIRETERGFDPELPRFFFF